MGEIPGKYIHKKTGSHYIELKADGSCLLFDGSAGMTGTYAVNDTAITISVGDSVSQGKIHDGIIIDDEGEKWFRTSAEDAKATVVKCRNCGSGVLETAKFCSNCGAPIGKVEPIPINRKPPEPTRRDAPRTDDPLVTMTWIPAVLRRDDFPWELIEAAGGIVLIIALFTAAFGHRP